MISKPKTLVIAILVLLILSISAAIVAAQSPYTTQKTTNVTIGSNGTFTATEPSIGVTYQITGVAGTTGTVTAGVYTGNPQPTATIPGGISLTNFIAITLNIPASDFTQAIITLTYTASEVQNIKSPYSVYKYISSSNSYVELPSTVDTTAKTITVTLTSTTDPLLAIGGTTITTSGIATSTWIVIVVSAIVIVIVIVLVVTRLRPRGQGVVVVTKSTNLPTKTQAPNINLENKPQNTPPENQQSKKPEDESAYSALQKLQHANSTKNTNAPPEKPKVNTASNPQSPISTTPQDKTAKQPKKEEKQNQQNKT